MKRLLGLLVVISMLVGLPLSHYALGKGKPDKVTICHLSPDVYLETMEEFSGVVISIPEHAADKHLARGDCLSDGAKGEYCNCGGE